MNNPANVPQSREPSEASSGTQAEGTLSDSRPSGLAAVPPPSDAENQAGSDCGEDLSDEYEPL